MDIEFLNNIGTIIRVVFYLGCGFMACRSASRFMQSRKWVAYSLASVFFVLVLTSGVSYFTSTDVTKFLAFFVLTPLLIILFFVWFSANENTK